MNIFAGLLKALLSLRTTLWLLSALLFLLFCGAIAMPVGEAYQQLAAVALFAWMSENSAGVTWWLWGALGVLTVLTANTIVCSAESLIRKRASRQWMLIVAPQLIHLSFLFILIAHLLSAAGSFRGTAYAQQGSVFQLPSGLTVVFDDVRAEVDPSGYVRNWSSDISYYRGNAQVGKDRIAPNAPSFREGYGVYIKTVNMRPGGWYPVALVEVSREPGAAWALAGGVLFLAGTILLLSLKVKREAGSENRRGSLEGGT